MVRKRHFALAVCLLVLALFGACTNPFMESILRPKTISFDSNGGSNVASQTVYNGQTVKEPSEPSKANFIFEGWYKDNETFENKWSFNSIPSASMTLYADWAPAVQVIVGFEEIEIEDILNGTPRPETDNITISRSGSNGRPVEYTVTIANATDYDIGNIRWEIAGSGTHAGEYITGTGASFTLDAADIRYNSPGGHTLKLTITIDGIPYMVNINFTVVD